MAHAAYGGQDFVDAGAFNFTSNCECWADGRNDDAVTIAELHINMGGAIEQKCVEVDLCAAPVADEFDLAE